jgi:uncharacterized surface protein with fasciclin (FAS1) repeats
MINNNSSQLLKRTLLHHFLSMAKSIFFTFFTFILLLSGCLKDEAQPKSMADVIIDDPEFTFLRAALEHANLKDAFKTGSLTMFAPTDAAFKASGFASVSAITALSPEKVQTLLKYHILTPKTKAEQIADGSNQRLIMLSGDSTYLSKGQNSISINGIKVTRPDVEVSNGVIHGIEKVLLPPQKNIQQIIQETPDLSLFLAAYNKVKGAKTDLSNLTGYTMFVPNNKAMEAIGFNKDFIDKTNQAILLNIVIYHFAKGRLFTTTMATGNIPMYDGRNVTVTNTNGTITLKGPSNGTNVATILTANILATNGPLHVIDRVLIP